MGSAPKIALIQQGLLCVVTLPRELQAMEGFAGDSNLAGHDLDSLSLEGSSANRISGCLIGICHHFEQGRLSGPSPSIERTDIWACTESVGSFFLLIPKFKAPLNRVLKQFFLDLILTQLFGGPASALVSKLGEMLFLSLIGDGGKRFFSRKRLSYQGCEFSQSRKYPAQSPYKWFFGASPLLQ